ncbi:MAG: VWA domain-containing protein [Acidobacteria bacterium]|nr:VWA domain-containing protein [Acidobacteriota bacterium]
MSIFADGKLACSVERPPYECAWDSGPRVDEHQLRVVAQLADGGRLVHTVRTQSAGYTESVDVEVVQVTATVTDGKGHYVRGLSRDVFHVFEDGVPQWIASFASENIPLELIVAVDVSGSMRDHMARLKQAVKQFLGALRPTDQVTLLAFNDNLFTLAKPSTDPAARLKAIDRLEGWGGTALYDVIVRSMDTLGRQSGRRALVVFSDGEDQSSHITLSVAEGRVEASAIGN